MNSRDRVKVAINHKEPDRIPIDNNGAISGMHQVAYKNLLHYLNIDFKDSDIIMYDPIQELVWLNDEVKDLLGIDTSCILPKCPEESKFIYYPDGTFKDEFNVIYRKIGFYNEMVFNPLGGLSLNDIKNYKFPNPINPERFEGLKEEAIKLNKDTKYSIWGGGLTTILFFLWCIRGFEESMTDLYVNPKISKYLIDKIQEWNLAFSEKFYNEVGPYIDVFWFADDWGTQAGPILSPELFKKYFLPKITEYISFIKTKTNAKCAYHSCGSTNWVLNDLINAGIDIIQPVQPNAFGNNSIELKNKFGKKVVFHGGTNNQGVFHLDIHTLTIDTLKRIRDLAPGGGYIFSSGHNIQANMPPENIIRLFELAKEYGRYPINFEKINERIKSEEKLLVN